MKLGTWLGVGFLSLVALALLPSQSFAQGGAEGQDPVEKAWMEAGMPGARHEHLAGMAGTWTTLVKSWMDPGAPPTESKGSTEFTMELGGRYLMQRFHGEMMGMPFEGLGYTSYDNVQKKFVSVWMDNMSTGIMMSTGVEDPSGKRVVYVGSMWDAVSGAEIKVDDVLTEIGPDQQLFEMFMPGPDGKRMKCMEITYTRKK